MMPLLLLPLLLSGCVDEFPVTTEVPYGGDGKGLSVEEAKTFFESYVSGKASRSVEPEEHDNGFYISRLMLPVGEFVPSWEEGLSTDAPSLYSVDVPVRSDFSFRVLRVDKGSGKVYQTKCWHKLLVVEDPKSGNMGCFIAFFIPDRAYALSHGGDIGRVLTNGEEMGDYSGVKIYTTLEGRRVRVNRYENGKKVEGIYIDGASDREDYIFRMLHSEKIIGKVWLTNNNLQKPESMITQDKITDIFCMVDEFSKKFDMEIAKGELISSNGIRRRHRNASLSDGEIMTILIVFHFGTFANFKHYYLHYIRVHLHQDFPDAVSYNRFVELESRVFFKLMFFLKLYAFGRCSGISFVDSTMIPVCHNLRRYANKVFKGMATDGKGTMGWCHGFKLHFTCNDRGEIITFCLTGANVDDRNPKVWNVLAKELYGRLFADRGYISQDFLRTFLKMAYILLQESK